MTNVDAGALIRKRLPVGVNASSLPRGMLAALNCSAGLTEATSKDIFPPAAFSQLVASISCPRATDVSSAEATVTNVSMRALCLRVTERFLGWDRQFCVPPGEVEYGTSRAWQFLYP